MNRIILILSIFVFTNNQNQAFAQKKGEIVYQATNVPIDETTKLINYTNVVNSEGKNAKEIYEKALRWVNSYYKNPTEVLREKSAEETKFLVKGRSKYLNPADKNGLETQAGILQYSLVFLAKDGRFKYEIKDWNIKAMSYEPVEFWMNKTSPTYNNVYAYNLIQLEKLAKEIEKSLIDFMNKPENVQTKEW
jgi:hypothetical protein